MVLDKLNFRDLGGIPVGDSQIRAGTLFRGEGPLAGAMATLSAGRLLGGPVSGNEPTKELIAWPVTDWNGNV